MKRMLQIVAPLIGKAGILKYSLLGILSGLCGFLFMNMVTRVIGLLIAGKLTGVSKEYIIIFAGIILMFIWVRRTLSLTIINLSQNLFWRMRSEILALILNASYEQLSKRKDNINTAILHDVNVLTSASFSIIEFFSAIILTLACLIYMSTISLLLLAITMCVAITGVTIYYFSAKRNNRMFQASHKLETRFQKYFKAILDGFKEIYMEPRKGKDIYQLKVRSIGVESRDNNKAAYIGYLNNQITGQILFYILISTVLLYFSFVLGIKAADVVSFVFTLLYLLSSIEVIMVLLPAIMRAKVAATHLMDLKDELDQANFDNPVPDKFYTKDEFSNIIVEDLEFNYTSTENGFKVGPINFSLRKGETVFIYGGNGSGKTTFVNSILGLIKPSAGRILFNEVPLTEDNYPEYRTLFSVVFSDFYLFDEIYGNDHINIDKWHYYLELFEIQGKVTLEGNAFSTLELSTGQRKRLALIAALLEEKPVVVMDEWAADQDPYFRKKFYTEIIPLLNKQGITILAITHDERYYHCADRLYKMDYGKLTEEKVNVFETIAIS
ncbi:cyclic peptide export ABC transporter [Chitinophaga silvisoli]|uniref:Cyclic peptide export ABC transporter n=1 Tax=Chitinophaga silvisoli TaxID=2291814 RepID=A0A3E1P034_9BACT|nr:cyclic peptide export ABC transporter [Chitinophaga silvisoli]RFM33505.1 cyclic peptide export ABC transporter [Chitinophaga silvisoli]